MSTPSKARKSAASKALVPAAGRRPAKKAGAAKRPAKKPPKATKKAAKKRRMPSKALVRRKKLDLRDPAVRADLRARNLERLKDHAPGIYNVVQSYKPLSKLVVHDDGQVDTSFEGELFYNGKHDEFVADQLAKFWKMPTRMKLAPLQPNQFDDTAGLFIHNMLKRAVEKDIDIHVGHFSDESFFLYIMGLGLGGHIMELVERTNCKALAIVEPNPEFLVHSMETFDWTELFDVIDRREAMISIFVNNNPMTLSSDLRHWLRGTNPMSVDGSTAFIHYNNPILHNALKRLSEDRDLILTGLGFFYDESLMIKNTHHNLYSGKERVYMQPDKPKIDAPAFVIGNGPSLDNDLEFIRENQDKAIVISSGSALRPLMLSGIVPDFQMETENIDVYPLISQVAKDFDLSPVTLVTSSTVDIEVPPCFERVLYYFRGSLSPYPIFCDTPRRCLSNPNPTVVNASLSLAQEMGFRRFYLFGTDMGTTMGPEKHHSKLAYQYTEGAIVRQDAYNIPVAANFGGICMSSSGMYWTRDAAEKAIALHARGRFYFNCSNGARIEGTVPMPSKLVELPDLRDGKKPIVDKICSHFPVYDRKEFDDHWNDEMWMETFDEWLDKFEEFTTKQKNFDDMGYLFRIMELLSPKSRLDPKVWGPPLVFRGTLFQVMIALEFYLRRIATSDVRAFEKIARDEVKTAVDYLRKTAKEVFGTLSRDAEKRLRAKKKTKTGARRTKSRVAAARA